MIRKRITTLSLIVSLVVSCACANAAYFRVDSDSGAALRPGDSFSLKVYMTPGDGEKVDGAKCTINVDPEFIEISPARSDYSADPTFKLVEVFKTDPEQGMVSFRARTAESVEDEKLFLVVPAKLKKEGSTFVNLTSSTLAGDGGWAPSAPGYFKLLGVGDEDVDPLIATTLESENSLLNAGAFYHSYKVKPQSDSSISSMQFDMGMTALEQAEDEATADIVVKFSKDKARIGLGKYVRLDLMVEKYPESNPLFTGIDVRIKFDPSYLQFTNSYGQPVNQVEIVKRLDELSVLELKKLAKGYEIDYASVDFRGEAKPAEVQQAELIQLIRAYEGFRDETMFSFPFGAEEVDLSENRAGNSPEDMRTVAAAMDANFVDAVKGEIHLMLLVDFSLKREDIKMPQKVVTLIFKSLRPGENIPVEITEALLGETYGTMLIKNSYVTIDPKQDACDKSLPAALCKGSFEVTGDVAFDIMKQRTQRASFTAPGAAARSTVIEKFALTETWNLHMNGSLENGLKVKGHINKIPYQEQKLDVGIIGDHGSIRFGDFNTGFNGTTKVNTQSSQISGMEFQYGLSNFTFSALMAEGRSETKTSQIRGNDNKEYALPAGAIINNSVQIINDDGSGKVVSQNDYVVDYAKNTVTFKEFIPTGVNFIVKYEQSTFIFSSGNINSFGLAYDSQKDNPQKKERFKVDTAYMTSAAAKGGQKFTRDVTEALNMGQVPVDPVPCPKKRMVGDEYQEKLTCRTVYLKNRNIVKDSIVIRVGTNTFTSESGGVYITHRSYSIGKVTLDFEAGFKGNITISYSYYEDSAIFDKRVITLNSGIPLQGNIGINEIDISWPPDVMHGSEEIYISKNTDSAISRDDLYLEYRFPGVDPWIDENEDTIFSQESIFDSGASISSNLKYHYDTQFLDVFPTKMRFDADVGSEGSDYVYLKMRYKSAPPEIEGSSEFKKTALGVDVMYQPKRNLRFDAQYAITNSDLSSSYVSEEEDFLIDVVTLESNIDLNLEGKTCNYVVTGTGTSMVRKLECGLAHNNIKDPVEVTIQFCKPIDNDPKKDCETYPDGSYVYENEIYEFTSLIHKELISINKENPSISFIRHVKSENGQNIDITFDGPKYANINHRYFTKGDRVYVRYLYAQSVDQLVEGDALTAITNYNGKKLDFSLTKSITDPYYDKSFQGKLLDGSSSNVDTTNIKMNYRFNKQWAAMFEKNSSTNEKLEAGISSSTSDSVTRNYSMTYANAKARHLSSFSFSSRSTDKSGVQGLGIKEQNIDNANDVNEARMFVTVKKDIMNFNTSYKTTDIKDSITTRNNNLTTAKSLETNINPHRMLSTKLKFEKSASTNGEDSRTNYYQATLKPVKLVTIDMNFDRTSTKTAGAVDSKLTENNTYNLTFLPFYRISNFSLNFVESRSPASNTILYSTGTQRRVAKFDMKLMKGVVFTPSITQSTNTTENLVDSDIDSYLFTYKPARNRFSFSMTFSLGYTDTTTYSKYLSDNPSVSSDSKSEQNFTVALKPSKKSNLDVKYKDSNADKTPANTYRQYDINYKLAPSPNTTFSTYYFNKATSVTPRSEYRFNYSYNYNRKLSFSATYKKNRTGAINANDLIITSYDFNTMLKLSDTSTLNMTYKQTLTDGARNNSYVETPNFTAQLRSSFR